MIEGGSSANFLKLKRVMFEQPAVWHALMDKVTSAVIEYMKAQIAAGAQAVQLFDSWGGTLSPRDYREFSLPYSSRAIAELKGLGVPIIHFVQGNPALLPLVASAGSDVVGVDWRIEIGDARRLVGEGVAVQGNLEPVALFLPVEKIEERAAEIIKQAGPTGHIFNLGHGILPPTPVANAKALVDAVHRLSAVAVEQGREQSRSL